MDDQMLVERRGISIYLDKNFINRYEVKFFLIHNILLLQFLFEFLTFKPRENSRKWNLNVLSFESSDRLNLSIRSLKLNYSIGFSSLVKMVLVWVVLISIAERFSCTMASMDS